MQRRPAIVAYDVTDDRRRRRLFRCLRQWRLDGQLSVHECLLGRWEAEELFIQLGELIDPKEDRLLLAWLDGSRPPRGLGTALERPFERLRHWT